jgi:hypothetical protein
MLLPLITLASFSFQEICNRKSRRIRALGFMNKLLSRKSFEPLSHQKELLSETIQAWQDDVQDLLLQRKSFERLRRQKELLLDTIRA